MHIIPYNCYHDQMKSLKFCYNSKIVVVVAVAQPRYNRGQRQSTVNKFLCMCYLYILHNQEKDRYYIGSTINIERRLKEHFAGKTRTTKILQTNKLVYLEELPNIHLAREREKKLKSYKSKKYIKWLIE